MGEHLQQQKYHCLKARKALATDARQKSHTKPVSSSSKLHKEWLTLCGTSSWILAGNLWFLHTLWGVFAHANELFPLRKNISLSPFPLAKPAFSSLRSEGGFFSRGHAISMLVLNGAFKWFSENQILATSFVYLSGLLFFSQGKHEHSRLVPQRTHLNFPHLRNLQRLTNLEDERWISLGQIYWFDCGRPSTELLGMLMSCYSF